jgi:preprotein translocase subunit YajC
MITTEDISSVAELGKGNIAENAKNFLKGKAEAFIEAKKQSYEKLKTEIEDLGKQLEKSAKDYEEKIKSFGTSLNNTSTETAITAGVAVAATTSVAIRNRNNNSDNIDDPNQQEQNQVKKAFEAEQKAIQDNITSKRTELENKLKGYLPQELQEVEATAKTVQDTIEAKRNDIRNGNKIVTTAGVIATVSVLADYLLGTTSIGNKKIENLVDKVNLFIKNIKTEKDIQKARLYVNRAKLIININRQRLETIQTILSILEILIPLLDVILGLFKSNPVPSAVPPGVGVPLGTINTIDSKTKTLDDLKLAASVLLRIANKIVSKLLDDLNYQESRLLPIEGLLDSGLNNLTSSQIQNLGPQLGYLQGYDYKGFKFFIKEENNPKFIVKGNKRRYATAVNKDGNDVLQSTSSFTLSPDILIEELKLQIDRKGLVA